MPRAAIISFTTDNCTSTMRHTRWTNNKTSSLKRAVTAAQSSFVSFLRKRMSPSKQVARRISFFLSPVKPTPNTKSDASELRRLQHERNSLWIQSVALRTVALQEEALIVQLTNQATALKAHLAELQQREADEIARLNDTEQQILTEIEQQKETTYRLERLLVQPVLPLPSTPKPEPGSLANSTSSVSLLSCLEVIAPIPHTPKPEQEPLANTLSLPSATPCLEVTLHHPANTIPCTPNPDQEPFANATSLPSINSYLEEYSEESTLTVLDIVHKVPVSPTNVTEWLDICTKLNDLPLLPDIPSFKWGMHSLVSYDSLLNIASARNMAWYVVEGEPMGVVI